MEWPLFQSVPSSSLLAANEEVRSRVMYSWNAWTINGTSRLDISAIVNPSHVCHMPCYYGIITCGFQLQVVWPCIPWTLQFNTSVISNWSTKNLQSLKFYPQKLYATVSIKISPSKLTRYTVFIILKRKINLACFPLTCREG